MCKNVYNELISKERSPYMQCPNCGAELDENNVCPYCGYEDEKTAQTKHNKEITDIYEKIARLLHAPVERTQKIIGGLLIAAVAMICVFVIALLGAFVYSKVEPNISYQNQQASLAGLEEHYQAKEYDKMNEMLDQMKDSHQLVYKKYEIIGGIYKRISNAEEDAVEFTEDIKRSPIFTDLLQYPLDRLFESLNECRELEENGFVYDEEEVVASLTQQAQSILTEILLLTEEEIQSGMQLQTEGEKNYTSLCETIAQRVLGDSQ